jgi:hypothetical protein
MTDPDLLADARKRGWDIDLLGGEDWKKLPVVSWSRRRKSSIG